MHICMDIQSAITQRAGVGRYTRLLAQHLGTTAQSDSLSLFYFDFKRKGEPFTVANADTHVVRWCPGRVAQLAWKHLGWPPVDLLAGNADLYHFPNFILPPLRRGRSVVTIHDMSFARFPEFAEEKNLQYLKSHLKRTAEHADAIIAVSEFSAQEICELLKVPPDRVFAVLNGIDEALCAPEPERIARVRRELDLERPYLLALGTIEPRKNYAFLVDLFEHLDDFDGCLAIAGMAGWKCDPIFERFRNSPRAHDIRWLEYVNDDQLAALYAGAEMFICTSHYEGFGFPPLEAMACGTPVVSSVGGSLGEVLGEAAVVIDSFDIDEWLTDIRRVLDDSELRSSLRTAGFQQAAGFRWSDTAAKTWDIYRKVT